jgi:ADP-ribose pyrophosphatase YjhB (NUDIX family)
MIRVQGFQGSRVRVKYFSPTRPLSQNYRFSQLIGRRSKKKRITAMKNFIVCPNCGKEIERYRNPLPTVDIIIETEEGIVLIKRKNPPFGWALPGGFVDYGESLEQAAVREAREETSLTVELISQLRAYSDPSRDPRHHTISVVFTARAATGVPRAADDAVEIGIFNHANLPETLAFDHEKILRDYFSDKQN